MRILSSLAVLVGCSASGQTDGDIESICVAAVECGALAAGLTDACIAELGVATPDSATRATEECAVCVDQMTCGAIAGGGCDTACQPLFSSLVYQPGTVNDGSTCTGTSLANFAERVDDGVRLSFSCSGETVTIKAGRLDQIGATASCELATARNGTCPMTGTINLVNKNGRSWVSGQCECTGGTEVTLELPLRLVF